MRGGKHSNGRFVTSVYRYDPVAREMACDFGGAWGHAYDAMGHQKSAKPEAEPTGDRDFKAVAK